MFTKAIDELRFYLKSRTKNKCCPPWSWLAVKLAALLSKYPSGVTKAIILAEIQQSWCNFSLHQGRFEFSRRRKTTVDSICESKHCAQEAILEARIKCVENIPGTHTKVVSLYDGIDARYSCDMYLHQKFYQVERVLLKYKVRFTSVRLLQSSVNQKLRLLPSENAVIVLEDEDIESAEENFAITMDGMESESALPHYSRNIKVQVGEILTEEKVHLPNGETSIKRAVIVVDAVGIHTKFVLWDEQLPLVALFKEGDVLAIQQPYLVPNESDGFVLEYGPMTVLYCYSRELKQEIVQSQIPHSTPVSVTKDSHGNLDFSSFPDRVYITDISENIGYVTLFGTVKTVKEKDTVHGHQNVSEKFVLEIIDETGSCQVKVIDSSCSYHESLFTGQCIILEGLHSVDMGSNQELQLLNDHGGIIWNLSILPGWLATKCLITILPLPQITDERPTNCVAKAVIIQVNMRNEGNCRRVHSSCLGPVVSQPARLMCCQKCGADHLIQQSKTQSFKDPHKHWHWIYTLSVVLDDSSGTLEASITPLMAQQLLQVPACQFAGHVRQTQDQVLESVLAQQFLFGLSCVEGCFQIDSFSPVA